MRNDYIYDCEIYPNVFTLAVEHADAPITWMFEISDRRNESREIINFLSYLRDTNARMIGFNNLGFDYPILHQLIRMGVSGPMPLYQKAQAIIDAQDEDRWSHTVNPTDRLVPQIDLYKIHHFDNKAKATGLKSLEFNLRLDNIKDLPFPPGSILTREQIDVLREYNAHDVHATKQFYHASADMIAFREKLMVTMKGDVLNYNDTKIGKEFFISELESSCVQCYDYSSQGRSPRQTPRPVIHLKDAILPWITFEQPEFNRVLNWLKSQSITETKGVFTDLVATVAGFDFVFGLGGIHGSLESTIVEADDENVILDLDVSSYYPNLAIANRVYPAHLGEQFCDIYKRLYEQRKQYPKKSAESAMLKLALNGVYGDSNNRYSVFYDPLYTMTITLNGQLLLCLLAEQLMKIDGLRIIQINTDGLTIRVPATQHGSVEAVRQWWEQRTGLTLEEAQYRVMMIRDVNNSLAQYVDGSVKRKGAYEWKALWHQNAGGLVIPKVAEKVLIEGAPIRETVENWPDRMDFMLRTKVPRTSYLLWGDERVQNVSRYYIAQGGRPLYKMMPPLKGKTEWRRIGVESGWTVQVCNDIRDAVLPVNYDYYVKEVEKLVMELA